MGLLDPIRNYFRRATLEGAELDAQISLVRRTQRRIQEAANDVDTSIPSGMRLAIGGTSTPQADVIRPEEYYKTLKNSFNLYIWHATYGGCIDSLVGFSVGRGMKVSAKQRDLEPEEEYKDEEKASAARVNAYWQACWEANGMDRKDKEIERRRLRDGDAFLSFEGTGTDAETGEAVSAIASVEWESEELGTVTVPVFRFLDPQRVRDDGNDKAAYGVLYGTPADPERPVGYQFQPVDSIADACTIDPALVIHYKGKGDSDWPRGVPYMCRVLKTSRRYDRYQDAVEQRLELGNCTVMHIGYKSAAAQNAASEANKRTASGAPSNEQKRIEAGGILRTYGNAKVSMLNSSVEGATAKDARIYDLQYARAGRLAENTVSGNAENNNRASIEVAQDPQTSGIEDLQDDHAGFLKVLGRFWVRFGKAAGVLREGDQERFEVDPRPIVTRNAKEEAGAMTVLSQHGLSDRTILSKSGYDPDREAAQCALELKVKVERNAALNPDVDADQDEEDERDALKRQKAKERRREM